MSAHVIRLLSLAARYFMVWASQESWLLYFVNMYELFSRLWDALVASFSFQEPLVELLLLSVLLDDIFDVCQLHLTRLRNLFLLVWAQFALVLLTVCHRRDDLVLGFKNLDFCVIAPDHHFDRRFRLKTSLHKPFEPHGYLRELSHGNQTCCIDP